MCSEYAPLRDAFNDLNKLLIDKQQWDAKHEADSKEAGIRRQLVESDLMDKDLKRKGLELQAMRDKDSAEPVVFNIYDFTKNTGYNQTQLFEKSNAGQDFVKAVFGPEATVDRVTGVGYGPNGDILRMPKAILAERAIGSSSIIDSVLDPQDMMNVNLDFITSKQAELEKELRATPVVNVAKRKSLQEKLAEVKSTRNAHLNKLDPAELEPLYRDRVRTFEDRATKAASSGVRPEVLTTLQNAAKRANDDWVTIQTKLIDRQTKKELKELEREKERTPQQHLAQLVNVDTGEVTRYSELVNVPKIAAASSSPQQASGGKLAPFEKNGQKFEWVWSAGQELALSAKEKNEKLGENKLDSSKLETSARTVWEQEIVSDNPMIPAQKVVAPADKPREIATKEIALKLIKSNPKKYKIEMDPVLEAKNLIVTAEKTFMEDVINEARKHGIITDPVNLARLSPEDRKDNLDLINLLAEKLANVKDDTGDSFVSDFKYVPKFEHQSSLDRSYPQILGQPKTEEK